MLKIPAPLPHSAAAERNRAPILAALFARLPPRGLALELACGTGQHAEHFAAALPDWQWQPSDADAASLAATHARIARTGLGNVREPRRLDVREPAWPAQGPAFDARFGLIFAANLLHISPWESCAGLMRGAARHLAPNGQLALYGPFVEDGVPTAPSNLAFDADLRTRDARWGLRRLADVQAEAAANGLALAERLALPANNLLLFFQAQAA